MENMDINKDIITLNASELFIRCNIDLADASPFIAHCPLTDADKLRFCKSFAAFIHGEAPRIPEAFRRWPLTSVWNFANALSASYGEDDHAVYRVLDDAFGVSIVGGTRTQISEAFRSICRRFGLCYEGSLRRVNDYLAQAGIANTQLHYVARAFLLAERAFGPAPLDNTSALNSWEDDATHFLPPGLSIPRMVLEVDVTAHYAFLFTRFQQQEKPRNCFEQLFFDEIDNAQNAISAGQYLSQAVARPSLVWGRGGLALALPKLEGRLTVSLGGETRKLRGGQHWPLSTPWPEHIDWSFDGHTERVPVFPTPRHLLAFDHESGRLITSIDPAQSNDLAVDGHEIVLVASSQFSVGAEAAFPIGCDGHARHCVLGPSAVAVQSNSGTVKLRAKPKPRIWIEEGAVAKGPKGYLVTSGAALGIEFGDIADETFDLALSVGDREQVIPLGGGPESNFATCQLLEVPEIARDLVPVKAELRLRGSQRALVRYKAWLWPGLCRLTDGIVFESSTIPDNYCAERSRHIATDRTGRLCLDAEAAYETATLSFNAGNERIEFEIPRPGISLSFIDVEGRSVPLKVGEPLIVLNEDKGGSLVVRCPERLAALNVRGRVESQAFRQSATRVLSIADLIASAPRDDVSLSTPGGAGIPILLTRIVPALAPQTFVPKARSDGLSLDLRMPSAIDALRLSLEDETNNRSEYDCALTHREVANATPSWFHAELDAADTRHILVRLHLRDFHGDLSLARILVRPAGNDTFHPLRNLRGDNYGLVLKPSGPNWQPDAAELRKRFVTVNSWMQLCFSRESWDFIGSHIEPRWMALGEAVAAEGPAQLLSGAHLPRLPGTARSWVPLSHPLQIMPALYGVPAKSFHSLTSGSSEGSEHLALLAETDGKTIPEIHKTTEISLAFLTAFRNFARALQTHEELRGFDFTAYSSLFAQYDTDAGARWFWRPGDRLLGPAHYGAALGRLIDRLHEAGLEEEGSNDMRIRAAMSLCNEAKRLNEKTPPLPRGIETSHALIELAPTFISGFARASRRGTAAAYLSALADKLARPYRRLVGDAAFLIRLGPELLAFFLLFWELESERPLS